MDLIVSGMALSYQWWPSITHFEESLFDKRELSPAMVEQAGEVIYQAVRKTNPKPGSKLSIILDPNQIELGHYLSLLEKAFSSVDQVKPGSTTLFSIIRQAADLIQSDHRRQVAVCEISTSGSAAFVLSSPEHGGSAYSRLKFSDFPELDPSLADYIVLNDLYSSGQEDTIDSIKAIYQDRTDEYPIALGCSRAATALSSEIITFIQTVLSISNKIIPACRTDNRQMEIGLTDSLLYQNRDLRPWLSRGPDYIRSALLWFQGQKSAIPPYLILEEVEQPDTLPSVRIVAESDPYLIPLSGSDEIEILNKLALLDTHLAGPGSLQSISNIAYKEFYSADDEFVLSLLAANRDELNKELAHAKTGLSKSFISGNNWTSPNGSYFTATPLGSGGIAFVYPGAFNSYQGMGRDLFFSFPGLQDAAKEIFPDLSHSMADTFLYLSPSGSGSDTDPDQIMAEFYQHPNQLIESGISLSVLHTMILDQIFKIKPTAALGYSLGEASMLWANRIWQNVKDSSEVWKRSNLFKNELFGEMKAVRSYWNDKDLVDDFWRSFILKAEAELVQEACANEEMAFLSIVNTTSEVVIVGEREACQRVIEALNCRALPMPFNAVIHNPTMLSTYSSFVDLYRIPTIPNPDIDFYSASSYQKLVQEENVLAEDMAKMTCNPVDFPRLVNQVYQDGSRIFLEVGPQKTCSRWIEKILKDKPHASISINKRYQDDLHGTLKVIALLLSHRADVDLSALYPMAEDANNQALTHSESAAEILKEPNRNTENQTQENISEHLSRSYFENMDLISKDLAESHQGYLKNQQTLTRNLARLMQIQAGNISGDTVQTQVQSALFTNQQIQSFTQGDHRNCFGTTFSGFGDRRIPRLPNGELQFINRVIQIDGEPEQVQIGSSLISEYDLPEKAWFKNGSVKSLPHVSILEMALQPCGFLSAYLGSIKGRESQDLYFRNLDGEGTLLTWPGDPTETISNQVKLLSSSSLEDVIIQTYAFELSWGDQLFYKGTSSFGYFPLPMLENQTGLDAGNNNKQWRLENPQSGNWHKFQSSPTNINDHQEAGLPEISEIWISTNGGNFSSGYLFSRRHLHENDWFYKAHFFQDPVMPGSLGVENMAQALIASAPIFKLSERYKWRVKRSKRTSWKYRGQITPNIREFDIELHIKYINQTSHGAEICADGILWKNSQPIYLVENISLETY